MDHNKKLIELLFYMFLVMMGIILLIVTHAEKQASHSYLTGGTFYAAVFDWK